jgi:pimeloyl-ACP methyl ester carboxylesterase
MARLVRALLFLGEPSPKPVVLGSCSTSQGFMTSDSTSFPFKQVGAAEGRLLFYFHGVPGAPEEMDAFDSVARQHGVQMICLYRFQADPGFQGEAYFQYLAKQVERIAGGRTVEFVGFSIGAFVAIQTARHLPKRVAHLHLISAAAPLDDEQLLEAMAGKQVFKLVRRSRFLFGLLAGFQRQIALLWPSLLFQMLFSNAAGGDMDLRENREFRVRMKAVLQSGFGKPVSGYVRDLHAYVQPWRGCLRETIAPTSIWHGDADNWSPVSMAEDLASSVPGCTAKHILVGRSHYSCLYQALPHIVALAASANGFPSAPCAVRQDVGWLQGEPS